MNNELSTYMSEVNKYKILNREEEYECAKLAVAGDEKARERLVVANLRFVVQVANQFKAYTNSGKCSLLDLIQEGNSGLMHAATKFDPDRGYRFITYSVWWIRARIMSEIIKSHSVVKLGTTESERKLFFKMKYIRHLLSIQDQDERAKARKKVAKKLKSSPELIEKMEERVYWNDVSLERQLNHSAPLSTTDACLKDFLRDEEDFTETTERNRFLKEVRDSIETSMDRLPDREKEIIKRRYLSNKNETLQSIADTYGLSRERIRQLETNAFSRIKGILLKNETVREYVEREE